MFIDHFSFSVNWLFITFFFLLGSLLFPYLAHIVLSLFLGISKFLLIDYYRQIEKLLILVCWSYFWYPSWIFFLVSIVLQLIIISFLGRPSYRLQIMVYCNYWCIWTYAYYFILHFLLTWLPDFIFPFLPFEGLIVYLCSSCGLEGLILFLHFQWLSLHVLSSIKIVFY